MAENSSRQSRRNVFQQPRPQGLLRFENGEDLGDEVAYHPALSYNQSQRALLFGMQPCVFNQSVLLFIADWM